MQNKIKSQIQKYDIENSLMNRYFMQNAENRFTMIQLEFMLWRRGRFIRPNEKSTLLDQFLIEEIANYYEHGEINLPQLQFAATTRCTLRCKDCNAMIPEFENNGVAQIDLTFTEFKQQFDKIMSAVSKVRRFMLIGGEPLINKELADIVDYCATHEGISTVEIITNGTIIPSENLLEVLKEHGQKVYFHLSNYSGNKVLLPRLKYSKIIEILKVNGIRHQMSMNLDWNKEIPLQLHSYTETELQSMFDTCWLKRCLQVLGGRLSLCPRLSSGYSLGILSPPEGELIDLGPDADLLPEIILNFFKKSVFKSCQYCVRINERIDPAIQIGSKV
jgi:organic radical activating enzyme